jgi:hypothetical protein
VRYDEARGASTVEQDDGDELASLADPDAALMLEAS